MVKHGNDNKGEEKEARGENYNIANTNKDIKKKVPECVQDSENI